MPSPRPAKRSRDERKRGREKLRPQPETAARRRAEGRCSALARADHRRGDPGRRRVAALCRAVAARGTPTGAAGRPGMGSGEPRPVCPGATDAGSGSASPAPGAAAGRSGRRGLDRLATGLRRGPLRRRQCRAQSLAGRSAGRAQTDVRPRGVDRDRQGGAQGRAARRDRLVVVARPDCRDCRSWQARAGRATGLWLGRADLAAVRARGRAGGDRADRFSGRLAAPPYAPDDEPAGCARRAQGGRGLARKQGGDPPAPAPDRDGRGRGGDARGAVRDHQSHPFRGRAGL